MSQHSTMYSRRVRQFTLIVLDLTLLYASLWLALSIRSQSWTSIASFEAHLPLFTIVFFGMLVVYYIFGLYERAGFKQLSTGATQLLSAGVLNFLFATLFFYLLRDPSISPKTILLLTILFATCGSYILRYTLGNLLAVHRPTTIGLIAPPQDTETTELVHSATHHPDITISWVTDTPTKDMYPTVDTVCIYEPLLESHTLRTELYQTAVGKQTILPFGTLYERVTGKVPVSACNDEWFISNVQAQSNPYIHTRTLIDYTLGLVLGMISIVLFPCIALGIRLTSPGPIIFSQTRIGKGGKPFRLYKFRTMYALAADGSAETSGAVFSKKGDKRITPIGTFLRKSRLDELPQVWNLLRRDITIIGPRPERPEIVSALETDAPYFSTRTLVMPGITGWAAVKQHYTDSKASTIEKLQYDLYYIKHQSLLLDLKILLLTIRTIVHMKGQ